MKAIFNTQGRLIIIFAVCQLVNVSCTTQLYPEPSFQNIKSQAEKEMLQDFIDVGIEKMPDTGNTWVFPIVWVEQR